jgi:hypothetical protein
MILKPREYRFTIDGNYTRDSLPMARLAEYMQGFAALLGHRPSVHFSHLEEGSAVLVTKVEPQDEPKVGDRVRKTKKHIGPKDAADAYDAIDKLLREDNAVGRFIAPEGHKVIEFPGRLKRQYPLIGPISEMGTLDGVPVQIGGQDDPCWLHLEDVDGIVRICGIKRSDAIKMRDCLYEKSIRVKGLGRWHRDVEGKWVMRSFRIHDFQIIPSSDLESTVERLREIHARSEWAKTDDPLSELAEVDQT